MQILHLVPLLMTERYWKTAANSSLLHRACREQPKPIAIHRRHAPNTITASMSCYATPSQARGQRPSRPHGAETLPVKRLESTCAPRPRLLFDFTTWGSTLIDLTGMQGTAANPALSWIRAISALKGAHPTSQTNRQRLGSCA